MAEPEKPQGIATLGTIQPEPGITWTGTWGDKVQEGDLIRVTKREFPLRVRELRKFEHNHGGERPFTDDPKDDGHWYYGAVCTDSLDNDYHVFIQPHEPIFIATEIPLAIKLLTAAGEASAQDGEVASTEDPND